MKNESQMTVTINSRIYVDRKTAETCLRLVEAYVNSNPVMVEGRHLENGEIELNYVVVGEQNETNNL